MKRTTFLILAALLCLGSPFIQAEDYTFSMPQSDGYRVDLCRSWGEGCGEAAAHAFCLMQGYEAATAFEADMDIGANSPTRTLGDHKVCDQAFCDGFRSITCSRASATMPSSRSSGPTSRAAAPATSSKTRINPALFEALKKSTEQAPASMDTTQPPMPAQPEQPHSTIPDSPPTQPTAPETPPPAEPELPTTQPGGDPDEFLVIYPKSTQARMGVFGQLAASGHLEDFRTVALNVKSDLFLAEPGDFDGNGQTDLALLEYSNPADFGSVDIVLLTYVGKEGFGQLARQRQHLNFTSGMPFLAVGRLTESTHDDALIYAPAGAAVVFSAGYGLLNVLWNPKGVLFPIDANGDGVDEVLDYAEPAGTLDLVSLELAGPDATGAWHITPVIRPLPATGPGRRFAVGDFTGDGNDDLLIHDSNSGELYFAHFGHNGAVKSIDLIDTGWLATSLWTVGRDYDGDERDDLLVYDPVVGAVTLVRFTSSGTLRDKLHISSMQPGSLLFPGFFTGTGKASYVAMARDTGNRLIHVQFDAEGAASSDGVLVESLPDGGILKAGNFLEEN